MNNKIKDKYKTRTLVIERMKADLKGPYAGINEIIECPDGPEKEYVIAKLFPMASLASEDVIEEITAESRTTDTEVADVEAKPNFDRISSAGISFYVKADVKSIHLNIVTTYGRYKQIDYENKDNEENKKFVRKLLKDNFKEEEIDNLDKKSLKKFKKDLNRYWRREDFDDSHDPFELIIDNENCDAREVDEYRKKYKSLSLHVKSRAKDGYLAISIFIKNELENSENYNTHQENTLFQFKFSVTAKNTHISPIPNQYSSHPSDRLNDFMYRDKKSYAVGHTCSAGWTNPEKNTKRAVYTEWIPEFYLPDVSATGHESIRTLSLNAQTLSLMEDKEIIDLLKEFLKKYETWVDNEEDAFETLPEIYKDVFDEQMNNVRHVTHRIFNSISFLENDPNALKAFKLANETMYKQAIWSGIENYEWRPFQMGFLLLALEPTLNTNSEFRDEVDLLWFPTGGGKTEAYLFLTAVLLFYRKFERGSLAEHDGLAMITRYTLRALTLDQFKRLSTVVMSAEIVRNEYLKKNGEKVPLNTSFSIGIWVGGDATPNTYQDAVEDTRNNHMVISECPCCKQALIWKDLDDKFLAKVRNRSQACEISKHLEFLPIHSIDEQIYKVVPSIIIGTVDKFVQVIRRPDEARKLFALDSELRSPDLIIQDELHLISGPLGSMTGAIEFLIESYMTKNASLGPKIIGSTATIQRAEEQINSLYARQTTQFPINLTNPDDSFFSIIENNSPGRIYLGLSSVVANSATYLLQATASVLLQLLHDKEITQEPKNIIDYYSTLVIYFNRIGKLSAAAITLQDDVSASIEAYAKRHKEKPRVYDSPEELTGNINQKELKLAFDKLDIKYPDNDHVSALLASVMISVGLDISRLGLMLVDGQPKSIAEYIQATSRVGRNIVPGLVITIYNEYRIRDKSHYETFNSWHQSLYRYVESTGVTPFAARARQKTLPALFISLCLKELGYGSEGQQKRHMISDADDVLIENVKTAILKRVKRIDSLEMSDTKKELDALHKKWKKKGQISFLWNDKIQADSLFISAETAAANRLSGAFEDGHEDNAFVTPNSVREVEPGVKIKPRNRLMQGDL